jgi:small multidrug resistance family-3 protein
VARSITLFILAALCEIGGGYLVWLTIRDRRSVGFAIAGAVILVLYGIIPTLQPAGFSRVYAAYGAVFIAMSLLWGVVVDRTQPDRFDIIGAAICLIGAAVMMYWPRAV